MNFLRALSVFVCLFGSQAAFAATDFLGYTPLIWMTFDNSNLSSQGSLSPTMSTSAAYVAAPRLPGAPQSKALRAGTAGRPYNTVALTPIPMTGFTLSLYCTIGTGAAWTDTMCFKDASGSLWKIEKTTPTTGVAIYDLFTTSPAWTMPDAGYHHIAVSIDADRAAGLYIDGVLKESLTVKPALTGLTQFQFASELGGWRLNVNVDVDDFRIYDRALTPGEVALLYRSLFLRTNTWIGPAGSVGEPANWADPAHWLNPPGSTIPQKSNESNFGGITIADAVIASPPDFSFEGWAVDMELINSHVTINKTQKLQMDAAAPTWIRIDEQSSLTFRAGGGTLSTGCNIRQNFDVKAPQGVVFESVVRSSTQNVAAYVLHDRGSVAYNGGIANGIGHTLSFTVPAMDASAPLRRVSSPRTLISWAASTALSSQTVTVGTVTFPDGAAVTASQIDLTQSLSPGQLAVLPVGSYTVYKDAAGIHAVYVEPAQAVTYAASLASSGSPVLWSAMPWEDGAVWQNGSENVAEISGATPLQELVFDQGVYAGRVALEGSGPVAISAAAGAFLDGVLDLSGVTGGGAAVSAPLNAFPVLPPSGISTLTGANAFSGTPLHTSGTLELPAGLGSSTGLRLSGGNLSAGTGADTALTLELLKDATLAATADLAWSGAVTGSGTLTKAGSGTLTFTSPKAPGAIYVSEGALVLNAAPEATAGLLPINCPVTIAPGAKLVLAGTHASGPHAATAAIAAAGAITLEDGTAETPAVLRLEAGARDALARRIYLRDHSSIEIAEGAALTLTNAFLAVKTNPQTGYLRKAADAVTDPVVTLDGTVTLYSGDANQYSTFLQIPLKLQKATSTTGNLTKEGVGNVSLTYGTPGGDASVVRALSVNAGTLVLSQGAIVADSFVATGYNATTVTPQANLTRACLTAGSFSFGANCRIELSTNVANLPPLRYTLVKWTGDTAPALPAQLPNNMYIDGQTKNGRVPGWEMVRDLDRKAIILKRIHEGMYITLY